MRVSVVIRALNEGQHIGRLLHDLQHQTRVPDEVVLVDSGSTDDTVAIAREHDCVIVHIKPEDFSFGRALNVGCKAASGDVLVFASAHVYPRDEHWIANLTESFTEDDVALAYGRQLGDERTKFSEQQVLDTWFPAENDFDQQHPFCNNANCAIRRVLWEQVPYDEELTGLEDLDWANKMHSRGHRLVYRADAPIFHVHEESFKTIVNRYRREAIAHRRIFGDQRMNAAEAVALFLVNVVQDYLTALRRGELLGNLASIPMFRAGQFWGTYEGFNQKGPVTQALKRRFYYPASMNNREGRR